MTKALEQIAAILTQAGIPDADTGAKEILAAAGEMQDGEAQAIALARKRAAGTPLAHLIGRQLFMGVEILAAPDVLAAREETELLGQIALRLLQTQPGTSGEQRRIVDMCCGGGNLACAIASHLPDARVWASDLTDQCVSLARKNVTHLQLTERVQVLQGDLFAPLQNLGLDGTLDAVVCNPPYISTGRLSDESAQLLEHEPREAFDGGPYGLSLHQRVIRDAVPFLRDGGWLVMEFGAGQDRQLKLLLDRSRAYEDIEFASDPQGLPRVVMARKKQG